MSSDRQRRAEIYLTNLLRGRGYSDDLIATIVQELAESILNYSFREQENDERTELLKNIVSNVMAATSGNPLAIAKRIAQIIIDNINREDPPELGGGLVKTTPKSPRGSGGAAGSVREGRERDDERWR